MGEKIANGLHCNSSSTLPIWCQEGEQEAGWNWTALSCIFLVLIHQLLRTEHTIVGTEEMPKSQQVVSRHKSVQILSLWKPKLTTMFFQ